MRSFLVFAFSMFAASPVAAADWRLVVADDDPDLGRVLAFVDAATLVRTGDAADFRVDMRIERAPATADGTRARVAASCAERWFEISEASYYVGERWLKPAPDEARQTAAPGTNMYVFLENLCAGRFLSGTVDPVAYASRVFGKS